MNSRLELKSVDIDGAIREAAEEAVTTLEDGDTRRSMLRKAGLAGGAVVGGGALLGALVPGTAMAATAGRPPKSFGKGDVGILNYALTLEYLEAAFYNEASKNQADTGFIKDAQTKLFLEKTTDDENVHVKFLKTALKSAAVKSPKFDFGDTTSDETKFAATALVLENTGVHAYLGQVLNIKTPGTVVAAGSILTVEARHASVIGLIVEKSTDGISPDGAFDTPFTAAKILRAVKGTGFIVG